MMNLADYKQHLLKGAQDIGIPRHMIAELVEYVIFGRPPGEFLGAVISNDLMGALRKADELNRQRLYDYGVFLESIAPAGCFGSPAALREWMRTHGVMGRSQAADQIKDRSEE